MAIRDIVTRGFGNGTYDPGVNKLPTRGYSIGAVVADTDLFPGDTTISRTGPGNAAVSRTGPGNAAVSRTGPGNTTAARKTTA